MIKQIVLSIISLGIAGVVMSLLEMTDLWFWLFVFLLSHLMFVFSSEKKDLLEGVKKTRTHTAVIVVVLSAFVIFGDEIVAGAVRLFIISSFLISFLNITDRIRINRNY